MHLKLAVEGRCLSWRGRSGIKRVGEAILATLATEFPDIEVSVISNANVERSALPNGCALEVVPMRLAGYLLYGLRDRVRLLGCDALLCLGPLVARSDVVTVALLYDVYPLKYKSILSRRDRWSPTAASLIAVTWLKLISLRWAGTVLVSSMQTQADLAEYWTPIRQRVRLAYLGADPRVVGRPTGGSVQVTGGPHFVPKPYFLYVGSVNRQKGIETLLAAFARAHATLVPPPTLVVVGRKSWPARGLGSLTREAGVVWLEEVTDAELAGLYAGALAFVIMSRYEGFGLPLVEAMANGCAVIAPRGGVLEEVLGGAGVLVPLDDVAGLAEAMVLLGRDHALRGRMGRDALERAQQFTWRQTVQTIVEEASLLVGGEAAESAETV